MKAFDDAMARRLDAASRAPLAVALSGGGDSLALLHLTLDWAQAHDRPVLALTVDHDLNPQSAGWTKEAGEKARALGADWRGLHWAGLKPTTGLQARARAARHALLAQAAREAGARVLLMGHTADDIAEADLMRRADVPGLGHMREWSPSPAWPEGRGVFLLRPLLRVSREALRDELRKRGAAWLDDPANENTRFARVRARQYLSKSNIRPIPVHPREGGDPDGLSTTMDSDVADSVDGHSSGDWVPAFAGMSGDEMASLARRFDIETDRVSAPHAALIGAQPSLAKRALAAALLSLSGGTKPPRGLELQRLLAAVRAGGVATLCGCRAAVCGDRVEITRAPPRRGQMARGAEPVDWVETRFQAACGLVQDEGSIPPPF